MASSCPGADWSLDVAGAIADGHPLIQQTPANPHEHATIRALSAIRDATRILRTRSAESQFDDQEEPDTPPTWGPLRILGRLASGSFGDVFQAEDIRLGRIVALKLMRERTSVLTL